jgi:hypothetical protein
MLEGLVPTAPLVTPVPRTASCNGADALLANVTVPGVHPVALGEKVTFTDALCPAGIIRGKCAAEALNCDPFQLIAETVMAVWPLLVKTTTAVSLWPITTLPKCKVDGAQVNWVAARADRDNIVANTAKVRMEKTRGDRRERDWGSLISSV